MYHHLNREWPLNRELNRGSTLYTTSGLEPTDNSDKDIRSAPVKVC